MTGKRFFGIVFGINGGAHFIVVFISQYLLAPYLFAQREFSHVVVEKVNWESGTMPVFLLLQSLSFVIPTILIGIQSAPIVGFLAHQSAAPEPSVLVRRRLLHLPLVHSLLGATGWVLGTGGNIYVIHLGGGSISTMTIIISSALQLSYALFCFVLIYFGLEAATRKYFIPIVFADEELSSVPGALFLSIKMRFWILFFAITVFPLILLSMVFLGGLPEEQLSDKIAVISVMGVLLASLSAWLTHLVADSYQRPVVDMQRAAISIRNGLYDVHVSVPSNDEIGQLAENINRTAKELKEKEFIKDTFGRLVDPSVRDHLLRGNVSLGGELREVTVLFSDIRSFTSISEHMDPEELVLWLNRYFDSISRCIIDNGGTINKFIGDAILAVFGAPVALDHHADAAVRAALQMQAVTEELNRSLEREGRPVVRTGTGIHSGAVVAGNIGASSRMEYTVMGDTINLASRLETATKTLQTGIILSETTYQQIGDLQSVFSHRGRIRVKGREEAVSVYGLSPNPPTSV